MLVYCLPSNPKNLWKKFQLEFSRDYQNAERYNEYDSLEIAHKVLDDINRALQQMGKNLNDYWLMPEDSALTIISIQPKNIQPTSEELLMPSMLNDQQRLAYDSILKQALCNQGECFFVDGPGGTGKLFGIVSYLQYLDHMAIQLLQLQPLELQLLSF